MDLFLFPSKQEGMPMALMEAIASGISVRASNVRGNRELVLESTNQIEWLFQNKEELKNCLKKAVYEKEIDKIELPKKYDVSKIKKKMKQIYNWMVIDG